MDSPAAWLSELLTRAVRDGIITRRQAEEMAALVDPAPPTDIWTGTPYGYATADGLVLGDVLAIVYSSWADIAEVLNNVGLRTPRDESFSATTARANLIDRFQLRQAELDSILVDDDYDRLEARAFAAYNRLRHRGPDVETVDQLTTETSAISDPHMVDATGTALPPAPRPV